MNKFINLTLEGMNCKQLAILQAAIKLAGDNFTTYGDFFKNLDNKLTNVDEFIFEYNHCTNFNLSIDFRQFSVGGPFDCDPVDDPDFLKGGDKECE